MNKEHKIKKLPLIIFHFKVFFYDLYCLLTYGLIQKGHELIQSRRLRSRRAVPLTEPSSILSTNISKCQQIFHSVPFRSPSSGRWWWWEGWCDGLSSWPFTLALPQDPGHLADRVCRVDPHYPSLPSHRGDLDHQPFLGHPKTRQVRHVKTMENHKENNGKTHLWTWCTKLTGHTGVACGTYRTWPALNTGVTLFTVLSLKHSHFGS